MSLRQRLDKLKEVLAIDQKKKEIKEIEQEMNSADFWRDEEKKGEKVPMNQSYRDPDRIIGKLKNLKTEVDKFDELDELLDLADDNNIKGLETEVAELEKLTWFSGKYDQNSAIINFYAGAGGDDAQDWTQMLEKMYLKWAEENDYSAKILNLSAGGIAGIKSATVEIIGRYAYGKLKGESGVHRLVRQSPFNTKNLRQTSFSLVEVLPVIEDKSKEIEISDSDLKIDTFRASGHGGQSVNTTDSAVRITHLPTGIVATCQNERSQLQNKASAMQIIKARLAKLLEEQHKEKIEELRRGSAEPEWGSQIRSYVIHPYKLVKDHRTGYESKNPDAVLNGGINGFIEAEIKHQ